MKKWNLQLLADDGENSVIEAEEKAEQTTDNAAVELTEEQRAQIDKIATERTERATKNALKSYFQQQGLTEQQALEAIEKYKTEKAKELPKEAVKEIEEAKSKAAAESAKARQLIARAELKAKIDYNYKLAERLIDWSDIEVDDDGNVKNLDDRLAELEKEFPEIKKTKPTASANPTNTTATKTALDEYNTIKEQVRKNPNDQMLLQQLALAKAKLRRS